MFNDILVPLLDPESQEAAIRQAAWLAAQGEGRVVGLVAASLATPTATNWAYYPAGVYQTMHEVAQATVLAFAEAARLRLAKLEVPTEVRTASSFWLTDGETSTLHARYSDLVVVGIPRPVQDPDRRLFGSLMTGSGRPVLVVPGTLHEPIHPERVLVAWDASREASRALHDAMPFLERAVAVELLNVEDLRDLWPSPTLEDDAALLQNHLWRHGVTAQLVTLSCGKHSAGETILEHAASTGADLIVAGGFGRSRAWEQVFGGVTRHLLEHAEVPVLFSH